MKTRKSIHGKTIRHSLLLILMLCLRSGFSQQMDWVSEMNSKKYENIRGMGMDKKGNVYVVGSQTGGAVFYSADKSKAMVYPGNDNWNYYYLTKYSAEGKLLWMQGMVSYTSNQSISNIYDLFTDPEGNTYITGALGSSTLFTSANGKTDTTRGNDYSVFVAKYSTDGNILWNRRFGLDRSASKIYVDEKKNIYLQTGSGNDCRLFCTDSLAKIKWSLRNIIINCFAVSPAQETYVSAKTVFEFGPYTYDDEDLRSHRSNLLLKISPSGHIDTLLRKECGREKKTKYLVVDPEIFINHISFDQNGEPKYSALGYLSYGKIFYIGTKELKKENGNAVLAEMDSKGEVMWYKQLSGLSTYNSCFFYSPESEEWVFQSPINKDIALDRFKVQTQKFINNGVQDLMLAGLDPRTKSWKWAFNAGATANNYHRSYVRALARDRYYIASDVIEESTLGNYEVKDNTFALMALNPEENLGLPDYTSAYRKDTISEKPKGDGFDYEISPEVFQNQIKIITEAVKKEMINIKIFDWKGKEMGEKTMDIDEGHDFDAFDVSDANSRFFTVEVYRGGKLFSR